MLLRLTSNKRRRTIFFHGRNYNKFRSYDLMLGRGKSLCIPRPNISQNRRVFPKPGSKPQASSVEGLGVGVVLDGGFVVHLQFLQLQLQFSFVSQSQSIQLQLSQLQLQLVLFASLSAPIPPINAVKPPRSWPSASVLMAGMPASSKSKRFFFICNDFSVRK